MTPDDYIRVVFGLLAVLGMIGLAAFAARKAGFSGITAGASNKRRLAVTETLALDGRRRIVIIRSDDREHVVILGMQGETLIESREAVEAAAEEKPAKDPFAALRAAVGDKDAAQRAA